ncbi:MAG: hypothetical protein U0599_09195 [Vicinamibacteria bacterium]
MAMVLLYPDWVGEAGDRLPAEVWRILFPLRFIASCAPRRAPASTPPSSRP